MKLLLSGGGDPEQVVELDKFFADYVDDGKVLYIPVAMDKIPYEDCFTWFKTTYAKYNIKDIEMCTDLNGCDLKKYKAVFIGGGNTFKLLKEIKDSSFDKKIIEYLENGGFVYGGSAGAIIFGLNIKPAIHADKNNVAMTDFTSLNLLKGKNVWCHYTYKDNDEIRLSKEDLYILYEESGIYFDGKNIIALGKPYLTLNDIQ